MKRNQNQAQCERAARRRSCEPPGPDNSMQFFRMQQLWELAAGFPIQKVRLAELDGFDEVHWFGGGMNVRPACRAIAEHARNIYELDFGCPIILSPTGELLDGCITFAGHFRRELRSWMRFN